MTLLATFYTQVTYYYVMLVGSVVHTAMPSEAIRTRCKIANQLKRPLYDIVGELKGVALLLGSVAGVALIAILVIVAFTKHINTVGKVFLVIFVAVLLLAGGITFMPASPC